MRQFKRPKLDAVPHPETRTILAGLADHLQEITAALSKSVLTGPAPAADPSVNPPLLPPSGGLTLPSPTQGTLLRGTARGAWENLAIGTSGQVLQVAGGTAAWASLTLTNPLLDGSVHSDTVAQTVSRGSLVYGNSTPKWDELVIGASGKFLRSDGTDPSWQALVAGDLPSHGASAHTDRTRTLWFDPMLFQHSVGISFLGTPPNVWNDADWGGASDTYAWLTFAIPQDYASAATFTLYWAASASAAGKNVKFYMNLLEPVVGTTLADASGNTASSGPFSVNSVVAKTVYSNGLTVPSVSFAAGDIIRLTVGRQASSDAADDASTVTVYFLGLKMDYTADM